MRRTDPTDPSCGSSPKLDPTGQLAFYSLITEKVKVLFVFCLQAMSAEPQKFCLKWNDYRSSVAAAFEGLRQDEELVDITLCCEGKKIKAHRMMLSACSPFFRELLKV